MPIIESQVANIVLNSDQKLTLANGTTAALLALQAEIVALAEAENADIPE